jgi:hypothetical protein
MNETDRAAAPRNRRSKAMVLTEQEAEMVETLREWSEARDTIRLTAIFENGVWELKCECTVSPDIAAFRARYGMASPPAISRGVGTTFVARPQD